MTAIGRGTGNKCEWIEQCNANKESGGKNSSTSTSIELQERNESDRKDGWRHKNN